MNREVHTGKRKLGYRYRGIRTFVSSEFEAEVQVVLEVVTEGDKLFMVPFCVSARDQPHAPSRNFAAGFTAGITVVAIRVSTSSIQAVVKALLPIRITAEAG